MDDPRDGEVPSRLSMNDRSRDAARISAEIAGPDGSTDPFAAAARATRMPMIITNPRLPDNPVVFANASFCRLSGYDREEIIGRNCRFLQGPDTDPATVARISAAVRDARPIEIDILNRRKDGKGFWNRLLMAPVLDANGNLAYFFASQVDVTIERERLQGLETHNAALMAEVAGRLHAQQESEAKLRFATEAGRLGIWDLDLRTEEMEISPMCKDNFGRDRALPFTYDDLKAAVHPDDRPLRDAAIDRAIKTGVDYDVEYRILRPDGAIGWLQVRAQVVRAADGAALRLVGMSLDVTARKQGEVRKQALVELSDRIRDIERPGDLAYAAAEIVGLALNVSRAGYGTTDPIAETIMIERDWNAPGVTTIAGTLRFRDHGSYIDDLKRGETVVCTDAYDDPRTVAQADRLTAICARSFINMPVTEQDGFVATFYVNQATARVWTAEELAFVREVADRTRLAVERRRVEEDLRKLAATLERQVEQRTAELQANQARLRTIFETSYQLQSFLATDGTVLDANATSLNLIEARIEDVLDRPFWEAPWFSNTPDMPELVRAGIAAAAKGEDVRQEVTIQVPSGLRSFDFSIRPIRDATGAVVGIVPEAMDITERRQAEDRLRQAQKMEAVGQLTGGLAHDFNNLLTGISGSIELLQTRISQGRLNDIERYTTAAQGAARRAAALTHRLLAFSRRQTLDPKPTDVNRLMKGMEELIRRTVGPQIRTEVVASTGLWTTLIDPPQLENALLNLCINARDALPNGGKITIETGNQWLDERAARERELPPGQYISLCVSDNGTGMPPDVIARAFDPFFTTKPIGVGTGLGLSMIYGFAKQSGGQVRIYSEVGQGTNVCLYLPRHYGKDEGVETTADLTRAPRAEQGETVLVVDDEPTVRMLVTEVLEDLGYTAIEAEDGIIGLTVLRSERRIDLLITDVGLPNGLNGRQVADAARSLRPDLKVLFITGYAENAILGHGHLDPGMQVVTKPFSMESLASRIKDLIAER